MLLAIAVGRPALGEQLLSVIMSGADQSLANILEQVPAEDQAWLDEGIAPRLGTWRLMTCANSIRAARHVHRFVYRAGDLAVADARSSAGPQTSALVSRQEASHAPRSGKPS